jgi:hypothetical protein
MASKHPQRKAKAPAKRARAGGRKWSQRVTDTSDALTLDKGVFSKSSPREIAASLKRSAQRSRRRKSDPYRSAMSMLNFYINRGGRKLSARRKATLERAKDALREQFHKPARRSR